MNNASHDRELGGVEVVLVHWPDQEGRRDELIRRGQLALLLVERNAKPPDRLAETEDWVRLPADALDIRARVSVLASRHRQRSAPQLRSGVLSAHGLMVDVPALDERLLRLLLQRDGAVVSREALMQAGWPDRSVSEAQNNLDVQITRLRKRLRLVKLQLVTVRSRGYRLVSDFAEVSVSGSCQ